MRSFVVAALAAFALALPGLASAQEPTPAPTAAATATATPAATATATATPVAADDSTDDLPTMTDDDPVPREDPDWEDRSRGGGMLLGFRAGFHAFEPSGMGDGGIALEITGAMPLFGSFYVGGAAGYHTGLVEAGADGDLRFFDAQYGAIEGQYRHNLGRVNLIAGLGVGVLTANTADVTLPDGAPGAASGTGPTAHAVAGAFYPLFGRMGAVAQVKYAFAPVAFEETDETLAMGGVTFAAGFDLAF